ncbi:MAG TPA: hypothetical protein EYP85_01475 [Armatimonadetes bacterium]|nr:hypothetical protein [Armatimonadota bacterium]
MAEITIRLIGNIRTGKKDIIIEYDSAADLTTLEHERRHREIVEQLIGRGLLTREELGEVRVERIEEGTDYTLPEEEPPEVESEAVAARE